MPRLLALALLLSSSALAVPSTVAHQGRLLDSTGSPLTGSQDLTFTLYSAVIDGNELWSEDHTVTADNGFYAVQLGLQSPLNGAALDDNTTFLAISVGGVELDDRVSLNSVPFALRANSVHGGVVDASSIAVGGAVIADSTGVHWDKLANVPAGLSDGDSDTAADLGCTDGQVLAYTAGGAACSTPTPSLPIAGGELTGALTAPEGQFDDVLTIPRLTEAERDGSGAAAGSIVFNTDSKTLQYFNGSSWSGLTASGAGAAYDDISAFRADGGFAYFDLDETFGTEVVDYVGNHVAVGSAPVRDGRSGHARLFNGSNPAMTSTGNWLTGNAAHTFVITFKLNSDPTGTINALASLGLVEEASRNHAVTVNDSNRLGGGFYSDDYWTHVDGQMDPVPLNTWVQAAWAYNPIDASIDIFLNGELVGETKGTRGTQAKNFHPAFTIGGWIHTPGTGVGCCADEAPEHILIDEVALYADTLKEADIKRIYDAGFAQTLPLLRR